VLTAGHLLRPADIGLLASLGVAVVRVARRPVVAILATGDELVELGQPLGFGRIHDSNRYSLGALLEGLGIVADPVAHVRDDVGALREALSDAAAACDVIISSGGVSAGEADYLPSLLAELGRIDFWKVRMKPGHPVLCGEIGKAIVFGLPGNPVSSLATFLTLVKPGLMAMQGADADARTWRARLTVPVRKKHERTEYLRARLESGDDGVLRATPVERQGSGMMAGVAEADALIVIPEHARALDEGDVVDVLLLPDAC